MKIRFTILYLKRPTYLFLVFFFISALTSCTSKRLASAPWCAGVLNGDQSNQIYVSGDLNAFSNAEYYYLLNRIGSFTATNLSFIIDNQQWNPGPTGHMLFHNGFPPFVGTFSCTIPPGTPCNATETIQMIIYNYPSNSLFSSCFFTIQNQAVVSNFKIFGNTSSSPTIIRGCENKFTNFWANNIKLTYLGSGGISSYRIIIQESNASGIPISSGFSFTSNSYPAPIPPVLILNSSLQGTTTGSMPTSMAYYLVTLETVGLCPGGLGSKTALIKLDSRACTR